MRHKGCVIRQFVHFARMAKLADITVSPPVAATQIDPPPAKPLRAVDLLASYGAPVGAQIAAHRQVVLASCAPVGPHKLRVGLRRLRSAIKMLKGAISSDELKELAGEARDLGRAIAPLRDADVLIDEIIGVAGRPSAELRAALRAHRRQARRAAREALRRPECARFAQKCDAFAPAAERAAAAGDGGELGLAHTARKALRGAWREVRGRGRRLDALSIDERHEMRKSLKTLRYGFTLFSPLYEPAAAARYLKRVRKLQNVFGYLNDVAAAELLPQIVQARDKRLKSEIKGVLATHQERSDAAWRDAHALWAALEAEPRPW